MVESLQIETRPRSIAVTVLTSLTESTRVGVFVARRAALVLPNVGLVAAAVAIGVAGTALNGSMPAPELVAGQAVVKTLGASPRPAHETGTPAPVLNVTLPAWIVSVLPAMEACSRTDSPSHILVAAFALRVIDPTAARVAVATVGVPLQRLMGPRQCSGRKKLSRGRRCNARNCEDQYYSDQIHR